MSIDTITKPKDLYRKRFLPIGSSLLLWILNLLLLFVIGQFIVKALPSNWERGIYGILGTMAAVLATYILLRIEKKPFKDIGLNWQRSTILNFFKGILIGAICFSFLLGPLLVFTPLDIQKNPAPITFTDLLSYWPILPLALMEEIAFRAYPMVRLNKAYGLRITQLFVAIAFALYHVATGWTLFSAFLGPGVWAIVFGLSAQWSGGIAMPTGIHIALNILQPLIGMGSGGYVSVWLLHYPKGTTTAQMERTDTMGTMLQVLILLLGWLATEFYIRKKRITSAKQ